MMHKISRILLLLTVAMLCLQGCRNAASGANSGGPAADAPLTESPFPNKEPEKYQFEIWQTRAAGTEKFFAVRSGEKWRIDSAYGSADQVTSMHTDKDYVISFASKTYAEYEPGHGYDEREGMIEGMTLGMLNSKAKAAFEKLATADGVTTYKMTSPTEPGKESVISFDEKLGLPVKKEVFKTGSVRVLDVTVTINGFKTDVDEKQFALPAGFKKVPLEDMKKALIGTTK